MSLVAIDTIPKFYPKKLIYSVAARLFIIEKI